MFYGFRDNFEEDTDKFFTNDPNNQDTTWVLGSGDELLKGKSPAFDHTLLTDKGLRFFTKGQMFSECLFYHQKN